jgi:hypothetical protein
MVEGRLKGDESHEIARPRRYTLAGQALEAPRLAPGLYLVATPIGNLRDITLRALEMMAGADLVACEDTRVTRKLFDHYGLSTPLMSYHEHNAEVARPKILEKIASGNAVALVSDAGTPLISDPGYKLLRTVTAAGLAVTAAPGASAALMALTVSGLPTDRFFFGHRSLAHGARALARSRAYRQRWCCSKAARVSRRHLPTWPTALARAMPQLRVSSPSCMKRSGVALSMRLRATLRPVPRRAASSRS